MEMPPLGPARYMAAERFEEKAEQESNERKTQEQETPKDAKDAHTQSLQNEFGLVDSKGKGISGENETRKAKNRKKMWMCFFRHAGRNA